MDARGWAVGYSLSEKPTRPVYEVECRAKFDFKECDGTNCDLVGDILRLDAMAKAVRGT